MIVLEFSKFVRQQTLQLQNCFSENSKEGLLIKHIKTKTPDFMSLKQQYILFASWSYNHVFPPRVSLSLCVDYSDDVVHQGLDPGHQGDHRVDWHTVHHQLAQVEDW